MSQQDINIAKQEVENVIKDLTTTLTSSRQRLQELELHGTDGQHSKQNLELIELACTQVHHIVNEYFKDVGDNYVLLQSKYPTNEVKGLVLNQIDKSLVELNDYSQKLTSKTFKQEDYQYFNQSNFQRTLQYLKEDINKETENLTQQSQNVQKSVRISQEQLPQVKVNNRVVEGLYLNLNEYASASWPGDVLKNECEKPIINVESFFHNGVMPLPIINEEKSSYGYLSLADNQLYAQDLKPQTQAYQQTTIVSPEGKVYLIGGVYPNGYIIASTQCIDPTNHEVTTLAPMKVKRVAGSACYIPPCDKLNSPKGYILIFGGCTDNMVKTKLAERYNISTNTWEYIEKMNFGRARPSCSYHKESRSVYLFFGTDSNKQNISVVEKYDILENTWNYIQLTNYLPGFDVTMGGAVQINKNSIIIFGGMRDSHYFKDQMYFSRKVLNFNTTNETFAVSTWTLPIDFLPLSNPIVQDNKVYSIGSFLKTIDGQPQMYLEGGLIVQIDEQGPRMIKYVHSIVQK